MKEYKRCVNSDCLASIKTKNKICPYCGVNQKSIFFTNEELIAALVIIEKMVKVSGQISQNEEELLNRLFNRLNINIIQRREINSIRLSLKELAAEIHSKEIKFFILENCYNIGYSKGQLVPKEQNYINEISDLLGLNLVEREQTLKNYHLKTYTRDILNTVKSRPKSKNDSQVLMVVESSSEKAILRSSVTAGALGAIPIPYSSFFLVTPVQMAMVLQIGESYGYKDITQESVKELTTVLLSSIGIRTLVTGTVKFIPGLGSLVGAAIGASTSFSATYAMGLVASNYFKNGRNMTPEDLKIAFKESFQDAKKIFVDYKDKILSEQKIFEKKKKDFESKSGNLSEENKKDFLDDLE